MTFDHADLVAQERNRLLDPAAYARVGLSQKLVFRQQRARELPPALHQRLDVLQLRVGKRLGKPGARRRVVEHARQLRHHARMRAFPVERQVERARDERTGLMQVNDRHGQACRLQRARRFALAATGRFHHHERRRPLGNRVGQRFDAERLVPVAEDELQRRSANFDALARHADADANALGHDAHAVRPIHVPAHGSAPPVRRKRQFGAPPQELTQLNCNLEWNRFHFRSARAGRAVGPRPRASNRHRPAAASKRHAAASAPSLAIRRFLIDFMIRIPHLQVVHAIPHQSETGLDPDRATMPVHDPLPTMPAPFPG
ncbi:hypothetical protein BamMEX5DRAFT_6606 [Burkholderia ambifaria MEX-5]|uniref:Uncharacterized protein n=1 Tax=Burkholderia ambifaria MEX-5 TaxID=396597 RepID=B1TFP0_9BURK|nr:hypothetical protein BamMEX5DRAFT_6606 [Burkholderia ambifaria MEX-5]